MRTMVRVSTMVGVTAVLLLGCVGVVAAPVGAATGGGECSLAGTANFDPPGLMATSGNFTYNFSGALTGCNSNTSAPATGTVYAGKAFTYTVTTTGYTANYTLPEATGSGGCAQSTTAGTSVTQWADGTYTIATYTTTGALAAVELQGTVVASTTLNLVSFTGTTTPPSTVTLANGPDFPVGDGVVGQLVFQTSDPTACQTGLTSASISGVLGLGSSS